MPRSILRLHPAQRDDIADLVTRRPLPNRGLDQLDPFLFLNHHGPQTYRAGNNGLPFGPHPHRGFETVTFILAGELAHLDSGGHESVIGAGGVQWMTAGSGLVHAELSPDRFKQEGGPLEILQLWVNLPARLKMVPPRYIGLQGDEIPTAEPGPGVVIEAISGDWLGVAGPIPSLTGVAMAVVRLEAGAQVSLPVPAGRNVFCYIVGGAGAVAGQTVPVHSLVELGGDGEVVLAGGVGGAVILFGHAEPIGEPVFSHGPFVMNTREEIIQAITDYNAGLFGTAG
jgi:redox-sensitive bicupin YhaK (pirin superfamily)